MLWLPLFPWLAFSLGLLLAARIGALGEAEPPRLVLAFVSFTLSSLYSRYRAPFAERVFFVLGFAALGGHLLAEATLASSPLSAPLVGAPLGLYLSLAFFLLVFILRVKGESLFPEEGVFPKEEIPYRSLSTQVDALERGVYVIYVLTPAYPSEIEGVLRKGEEAFQEPGGYFFFVPAKGSRLPEEFVERLRQSVPVERYAVSLWRGEPLPPLLERLKQAVAS